jgi:hypothetical protein
MLSELATALLEGNQDPKAPITRGSVGHRCPYLTNFRSNPGCRDSGASNGIVKSMIICGVVEVTTTSGRSMVPGKAKLTRTVWPALRMMLASSSKIASWLRLISGRVTGQWLVTCDVVSAPVLQLRPLLSGAEIPGVPSRGRMDSRLR